MKNVGILNLSDPQDRSTFIKAMEHKIEQMHQKGMYLECQPLHDLIYEVLPTEYNKRLSIAIDGKHLKFAREALKCAVENIDICTRMLHQIT